MTLFFSCFGTTVTAQTLNSQNQFVGTWQHQDDNEVFFVTLTAIESVVQGYFKKVLIDINGNEVLELYTSKGFYDTEQTVAYVPSLSASYNENSSTIQGRIMDRTIPNGKLEGTFKLTIQDTCPTCPQTAVWQVRKDQGLLDEQKLEFNVPTDLILTKVE